MKQYTCVRDGSVCGSARWLREPICHCIGCELYFAAKAERDRICAMLRSDVLTDAAAAKLQPALVEMTIFEAVKRNARTVAKVLADLIETGANHDAG